MKPVLEANKCVCGGRVLPRYRKGKDPKFYCNHCGKNFTKMDRCQQFRD